MFEIPALLSSQQGNPEKGNPVFLYTLRKTTPFSTAFPKPSFFFDQILYSVSYVIKNLFSSITTCVFPPIIIKYNLAKNDENPRLTCHKTPHFSTSAFPKPRFFSEQILYIFCYSYVIKKRLDC